MDKKLDLVTIGHIIYDLRCYVNEFPRPDKTTFMQTSIQSSGGGSAANVAVDAVKLGLRAGLIGNVGTDEHGASLLQTLRQARVDISRVNVISGKSGVAIVLVNPHAEVEVIEMVGANEPICDVDLDYICTAKHLHMTGTNPDALASASLASKKGVVVSFDPGRAKSHLGLKKLEGIVKNCDYLLVNRHELKLLTGSEDARAAAKAIAKKYSLTCIIKAGAKPVAVEGVDSFEIPPFDVKPKDTIGAGDAFCAGFLTALIEKKPLRKAVIFANAVAAAKTQHLGAQSVPERAEIEKMFGVK